MEFVVDISPHCCSSTEDLGVSVSYLFEQLVFGPLSAVWLLVMPTVLPENDPGADGTHEACVGWEELPARAAKPQTKTRP